MSGKEKFAVLAKGISQHEIEAALGKTERLNFLVSPQKKEEIRAAAERYGISMTDYVVRLHDLLGRGASGQKEAAMSAGRDYNAELSEMAARISGFDSGLVVRGQRTKAEALQRLSSAYLLLRYVIERGDVLPRAPLGVRILYAKIVESVGGIHALLKTGLPGPAAQVFRGALETCIHLHAILKDSECAAERSTLFEEYLIVQRYQRRDKAGVTAEQRALVEVEFERVRGNYHPTHPFSWAWKICPSSKSRKGIPNNPDLKELCTFIDRMDYYEQLYGHLSDASHPVPSYELWLRGPGGHMWVGPKFTDHMDILARMTVAFAMDALVRLVSFLEPPDKNSFLEFMRLFLLSDDDTDVKAAVK